MPAIKTRLSITKDWTDGVFTFRTFAVVRGGARERGTVHSHLSYTRGFTFAQFRTIHIQQLQLFCTTVGLILFVCVYSVAFAARVSRHCFATLVFLVEDCTTLAW